MNELTDPLQRILNLLKQAGVDHMIAESFASTYYGAVRMTQDIDIIIAPNMKSLLDFVRSLPEDLYYVNEVAAREALQQRGMFNLIDMQTGWKVDFIIRKARPFSIEEFQRRKSARLFDVDTFVASAEDVILSKLEWASMSGSERQLADVAGMLAANAEQLDVDYLEKWANDLNVLELWRKVSSDVGVNAR